MKVINSSGVAIEVNRKSKSYMGKTIRDFATIRRVRDLIMAHLAIEGATATEIGGMFGLTSKTVRTRVAKASEVHDILPCSFEWPKRRSNGNEDLILISIRKLREIGFGPGDIAWVLGISESTVRRHK